MKSRQPNEWRSLISRTTVTQATAKESKTIHN